MKKLAVFCGSTDNVDTRYQEAARQLGREMAQREMELVYGGAKVGLMGVIADSVMEHGGRVTGVIPEFLKEKELAHNGLSDLIMVKNMHERKLKMHQLSEGFIALPGGFGTLEEFFETLTWSQLGLHSKPMGLLNINGFYDHLLAFIQHINNERFLKTKHRDLILTSPEPLELIRMMHAYSAPFIEKWMDDTHKT